tara:strand:- start:508 stop:753 length:246 start_codon:yes stop_codon:yes gene_type:complete
VKLDVQLFARARDLAESPQVTIDLDEPASVSDVRTALASAVPELAPLADRLLIAVGTDYADDGTPVTHSDLVACFPPVSGG